MHDADDEFERWCERHNLLLRLIEAESLVMKFKSVKICKVFIIFIITCVVRR